MLWARLLSFFRGIAPHLADKPLPGYDLAGVGREDKKRVNNFGAQGQDAIIAPENFLLGVEPKTAELQPAFLKQCVRRPARVHHRIFTNNSDLIHCFQCA